MLYIFSIATALFCIFMSANAWKLGSQNIKKAKWVKETYDAKDEVPYDGERLSRKVVIKAYRKAGHKNFNQALACFIIAIFMLALLGLELYARFL